MARRSEKVRAALAVMFAIAFSVAGLVAATGEASSQGYTCRVTYGCATCQLNNQPSQCNAEGTSLCVRTSPDGACACTRWTCQCDCGGSVSSATCFEPAGCYSGGGSDPCLDPEEECLPEEQ